MEQEDERSLPRLGAVEPHLAQVDHSLCDLDHEP
jgi:hypothetical protein